MTKETERAVDTSTWNKADDVEPLFILRGQDLLAPVLVRIWIELATLHGASRAKFTTAWQMVRAMEEWHVRKYPD